MEKTIRQLASEHRVSKQAIRARINKLPPHCYRIDATGTFQVLESGQEILRKEMSTGRTKKDSDVETKELTEAVNALTAQVDTLSAEKNALTQRVDELIKLLGQEQQLHALDKQKLLALEEKQAQPPEKKWWQFWL